MGKGIFFYNIMVSTNTWEHDYDTVFPLLREHGIDGFQFSYSEIVNEGEERLLPSMKKHGMKTYVIHITPAVLSRNAEEVEAAYEKAHKAFECAVRFECKRIMVVPMAGKDKDALLDHDACLEKAIVGFRNFVEIGKQYGIDVYIENIGAPSLPYASAEDVKTILDNVPGLIYGFDTGNYYFAGHDVHAAYELLKDRVRLLHLKNGVRRVEGDKKIVYDAPYTEGDTNLSELLAKIKADGICVPSILEFNTSIPYEDMFRDVDIAEKYLG